MAQWVDRTGEVYGALRVIGPSGKAVSAGMSGWSKPSDWSGYWRCECINCGAELLRTPVALRNARRAGTTQCEKCQDLAALGRAGRQKQVEQSISFDYDTPLGLLAQQLICKGLRV